MGDDAGWNDFGFTRGLLAPEAELTGPQAKTPLLDALAKSGVILKRAVRYLTMHGLTVHALFFVHFLPLSIFICH